MSCRIHSSHLLQALAQHARWERAESIRKEMELCNRFAAERRQIRYRKHFASCKDIVEQIVDLATKVGEYRLITGKYVTQLLLMMQ